MKFKYVGDTSLKKALETAETEKQFKAAEKNLYAQLPYIEAYGYRFNVDEYVEIDPDQRVGDAPDSALVVDKLKGNSHFEMHEIKDVTPPKENNTPKRRVRKAHAINEGTDS